MSTSINSKDLKVKMFSGSSTGVEKEINVWLIENKSVDVESIAQSGEANSVTVSIWYKK
jgi:hypothetical protein